MPKNMILVVAIGLLAVVGVWAGLNLLGKGGPTDQAPEKTMVGVSASPTASPTPSPSPVTSAVVTPVPEGAMKDSKTEMIDSKSEAVEVVKLEAGSFYFKPEMIKVKKGQTVRIVLTSADLMHDFNIDELGVKLPFVQNGKTGTIDFVADQVGSFEYYCSVGNHRANGQVGTLVVTE